MAKIKVAVLRGGPSSEYEVSLKTGEAVLKNLNPKRYEPLDILVDRRGIWHLSGLEARPEKVFRTTDVVFNAMHGEYGEDGKVQQILESHAIPFTGSGSVASALAMHKRLSRDIFSISGINIAQALSHKSGENIPAKAARAIRQLGLPIVVKPVSRGSSVGTTIAHSIYDLILGIEKALGYDDEVLIEKYIPGREATCVVLENFRGDKRYAFPVVEIIPPKEKKFFDYECKYNGRSQEICPGRFDEKTKKEVQKASVAAHQSLGCRHYSRSDFIVGNDGKVYILELNTLPGLTGESLVPKSAEAVGLKFPALLDHLITLTTKNPA